MFSSSGTERLLKDEDSIPLDEAELGDNKYEDFTFPVTKVSSLVGRRTLLFLSIYLLTSTLYNVYFYSLGYKKTDHTCPSRYSGLGFDTPVSYKSQTDYWGDNETLADELWDGLDTSPMVVALSQNDAREKGLSLSVPWPWDNEKGIYLIKAFHSLHCLKLIRKAVRDYHEDRDNPVPMFHVDHCLDSLRQDIMCKADDTPMPSLDKPHVTGNDQIMECRSWDKLVAWSRHPDRHSCFNAIDEYREPIHNLEQYAFCPPDSPSYMAMKAYFAKYGHKPAFGSTS